MLRIIDITHISLLYKGNASSIDWLYYMRRANSIAFNRSESPYGTTDIFDHRVGRVKKPFLQKSSELGLPQPLTRRRVCPSSFGSGWRDTLACGRGGGRVPIPNSDEGTNTVVLSIYKYSVTSMFKPQFVHGWVYNFCLLYLTLFLGRGGGAVRNMQRVHYLLIWYGFFAKWKWLR